MITVIYILLGIIVLVIIALWHDTYVNEKYLNSKVTVLKLTDEEKKTILRTYRMMVDMNESDYILGNITKEQYEKNLKQINEKIDWYERVK